MFPVVVGLCLGASPIRLPQSRLSLEITYFEPKRAQFTYMNFTSLDPHVIRSRSHCYQLPLVSVDGELASFYVRSPDDALQSPVVVGPISALERRPRTICRLGDLPVAISRSDFTWRDVGELSIDSSLGYLA